MAYLDNTGVAYLWGKIKETFATKSHSHAASDINSGTLGVSRGGTGVATITGIVKGNGTSAMGAASASDVVSLLGNAAVNRAAADGSGNNIVSTYATKSEVAVDGSTIKRNESGQLYVALPNLDGVSY